MHRRRPHAFALASVLAFSAALACDKTESTNAAPSTSQAPSVSTAPVESAIATADTPAPSASPPPSAPPAPADSAAAKTSPPGDGKKDGGAAPAASGAVAACGTKPLPDCPLQAWMKANLNPPVTANDGPGLAAALDKLVGLAPPGYTNWASISKDGASAARTGDIAAAKASCRGCHDQYKTKYKSEMRDRKI